MSSLTHLNNDGSAHMVDVAHKTPTVRAATARGGLKVAPATLQLAQTQHTKKGDPIAVAELAGIMGSKKTSDLIPLCHPLPLDSTTVEIHPDESASTLWVTAKVRTTARTGVEMEALTAVSVACLTLYDMLKAADKSMVICDIELVEKTGGASGDYQKTDPATP